MTSTDPPAADPAHLFRDLDRALGSGGADLELVAETDRLTSRLRAVSGASERGAAALALGDALAERAGRSGRYMLYDVALAAYEAGEPGNVARDLRLRILTHRANVLQRQAALRGAPAGFRASADAYTAVLAEVDGEEEPLVAAMLTSNRASSRRLLAELTGDLEALDAAIDDFRWAAAQPELDPPARRMALTGLAQALRQRGLAGAGEADLESSIDVLDALLEGHHGEPARAEVAMLSNARGTARFRLGELTADAALYELAISDHHRANAIYAEDGPASDLAKTHMNLGNVHVRRAELLGRLADFDQADTEYSAASALIDAAQAPADWAKLKTGFGHVLVQRGERAGSPEHILRGRDALLDACSLVDPATAPADWAMQQINIAIAEQMVSGLSGDLDGIEAALARYDDIEARAASALMPAELARFHAVRGLALKRAADLESNPDRHHLAAEAFRRALEVIPATGAPADRSRVLSSLGSALTNEGELRLNPIRVREGLEAYAAASHLIAGFAPSLDGARLATNTGIAHAIYGELTGHAASYTDAIGCYVQALAVFRADSFPVFHAQTTNSLGSAQVRKGRLLSSEADIVAGIACYRAALEGFRDSGDQGNLAATSSNLANALEALHDGTQDRSDLQAARGAVEAALAIYRPDRHPMAYLAAAKQRGRLLVKLGEDAAATEALAPLVEFSVEVAAAEPARGRLELLFRRAAGIGDMLAVLASRRHDYAHAIASLDAGRAVALRLALAARAADPAARAASQAWREAQRAASSLETDVESGDPDTRQLRQTHRTAAYERVAAAHRALAAMRQEGSDTHDLVADASRSLLPDEALVAVSITDVGGVAFIVAGDGRPLRSVDLPDLTDARVGRLLGDTTRLSTRPSGAPHWSESYRAYVAAIRAAGGVLTPATAERWERDLAGMLRELSDIFIAPLHAALVAERYPNGTALTLILPGRLAVFPLSAAPVGASDGDLMIDHWTLRHAPSVRAFVRARTKARSQSPTPSILGVTDPDAGLGLLTNPAVVAGSAFASTDLVGTRATREAILDGISEHSHVSFFCHGRWEAGDPEMSYLELAGGERLTVADLRAAQTTAQVAMLGACETAIVDLRNAPDEFVGFGAAFLEAGIPSLVSALWPVPAAETQSIAEALIAHPESPLQTARTLRQRQLELRDAARPRPAAQPVMGFRRVSPAKDARPGSSLAGWAAFVAYGA